MKILTWFRDARGRKIHKPADAPIKWRISTYVLVYSGGKVLTVIPTWNTLHELPGGEVHVRESLTDAAIRECYEETGYRVRITETRPIHLGEEWFYSWPKKTFYHSTFCIFLAQLKSKRQNKAVINSFDGNEITSVQWAPVTACSKKNTHRIVYPAIVKLRKLRKNKTS
jgi:8-oxo-dGTP pyrophosphatase MutT (NUDIX family)